MPKIIVKLAEDKYIEWSTISDAPTNYICNRNKMLDYLDSQYGVSYYEENRKRLDRADKNGTSMLEPDETVEEFISFNRAGENESCLTLEEILIQYDIEYDV